MSDGLPRVGDYYRGASDIQPPWLQGRRLRVVHILREHEVNPLSPVATSDLDLQAGRGMPDLSVTPPNPALYVCVRVWAGGKVVEEPVAVEDWRADFLGRPDVT